MTDAGARAAAQPTAAQRQSAATASAGPSSVTIFMVRHGQRIDETNEGRQWQLQAGDRWYDPPLTDQGKLQASTAAQQLKEFVRDNAVACGCGADANADADADTGCEEDSDNGVYPPERFTTFQRVYCSPLLRTLSTAEQFGRVLGVPVTPVAGLATCTAVFKKRGPRQVLLPFSKARAVCTEAALEPFDDAYGPVGFAGTVARLAAEVATDAAKQWAEQQQQQQHRDRPGAGASSAAAPSSVSSALPWSSSLSSPATAATAATTVAVAGDTSPRRAEGPPTPALVIVTHREGLRDTSQLTGRPFHKTKYCCCAVFKYRLHRPAAVQAAAVSTLSTPPRAAAAAAAPRTPPKSAQLFRSEWWSLRHAPEDFEQVQRRLRVARKVAAAPAAGADYHTMRRELKRLQHHMRGARRTTAEFAELLEREEVLKQMMHVLAERAAKADALAAPGSAAGRPEEVEDWNADGDEISAPPLLLPETADGGSGCTVGGAAAPVPNAEE